MNEYFHSPGFEIRVLIQVGKYQNIKTIHFLKISFHQLELVFSGINKVLMFVACMQYV